MKRIVVLCAFLSLFTVRSGQAAVSFTGSYSQDFNTLSADPGTNYLWANDTTLNGWFLLQGNGVTAMSYYSSGWGTMNNGCFYSFGTVSNYDRALGGVGSGGTYFGSPASGSLAGYIAVALLNGSSNTFDSFSLSFNGEQWRNGGNTNFQTMALQYGFGNSFMTVTNWFTPGGSFNYASPVVGSTAAAVDGNTAGRVNGLGGTISSLSWNSGDTLWVRWIEKNDAGNDHGLAIDDFLITATVVPEPSTLALGLVGGLAGLVALRRKH
jgi:hypothetical protein